MNPESTRRSVSTERIPFRVRIGGVGHRDPADRERLRSEVLDRVRRINVLLGARATTAVRFTLMSALADGSDQLITTTLLDELGEEVRLHAVIPTTIADYSRHLDPEGRFRELLTRADEVTELRFGGTTAASYAAAGRFIVRHSDLIVALWDGHGPRGRGGTAETVRYAQLRGSEVFVVATPRESEADKAPVPAPSPVFATPAAKRLILDYRHVDLYNNAAYVGTATQGERASLHERLEPLARDTSIEISFTQMSSWAEPGLARASALADRYQRQFTAAGELVFWLAALAAIAVAAQALLHTARWVVWIEVALMATLLSLYIWARRSHLLDRWLGYRSLAEAFRSALFIAMVEGPSGGQNHRASRPPRALADLASGSEPFHQRAFTEAWRRRPCVTLRDTDAPALADVVRAWLEEQIHYHRSVQRHDSGHQRSLDASIVALFLATLIVAVVHGSGFASSGPWEEVLPLLGIALPVAGGAIAGIRDQRSYRLHAVRSARTADGLEEISDWLEGENNLSRIRRLMLDAQSVIDSERQDWSGVVEFQHLELVL
jgi:Flp pilus assembly protein TadB